MNINIEKRLNILITASTFPRSINDTEPRFIYDLAKALTKYCNVTVLAPSGPDCKKEEEMGGVKVIRYRYFPIKRFESLCYPGAIIPRIKEKKMRAILVPFLVFSQWFTLRKIERRYDIVNPHWIIPQGIVQSFCRSKYVLTGHGGDVTTMNTGIVGYLKKRALKRANLVTVVSTNGKKVLQSYLPELEIVVRPMGCDTKGFHPKKREENFFNQGEKAILIFVGRLVEIKGVKYLIEAMQWIDALLYIVGEGPQRVELEEMAMPLDKIFFLGKKTHDELSKILASSDIFISPSITINKNEKEGVPVSIMEAMASGLPVIASNSGGIPDLIVDGKNGYLIEEKDSKGIADKINYLLDDRDTLVELGKNAFKTAITYDYSCIAKEYYGFIKSSIENEHN